MSHVTCHTFRVEVVKAVQTAELETQRLAGMFSSAPVASVLETLAPSAHLDTVQSPNTRLIGPNTC